MEKDINKKTAIQCMHEVFHMFEDIMRTESLKNGNKSSYRHLLRPLAIKDGVTQLDLVKITHLKAPTISTTLRNMEDDELVTRENDRNDARATRVFLTEKGRELDRKMRKSIAYTEGICTRGISQEELEQMKSTLIKMRNNLSLELGGDLFDEID